MALNVGAVRAGLKGKLEQAMGGEVQIATAPDQVTPPCLLIGMPEVTYHQSFQSTGSGLDVMNIPVLAILPRTHDQAAVDIADEWISGAGTRSVARIVAADQTLSGSCQASIVRSALPEFWPGVNGELPAYNWNVEVHG